MHLRNELVDGSSVYPSLITKEGHYWRATVASGPKMEFIIFPSKLILCTIMQDCYLKLEASKICFGWSSSPCLHIHSSGSTDVFLVRASTPSPCTTQLYSRDSHLTGLLTHDCLLLHILTCTASRADPPEYTLVYEATCFAFLMLH